MELFKHIFCLPLVYQNVVTLVPSPLSLLTIFQKICTSRVKTSPELKEFMIFHEVEILKS